MRTGLYRLNLDVTLGFVSLDVIDGIGNDQDARNAHDRTHDQFSDLERKWVLHIMTDKQGDD
jgi:hypothetical protein